MSLNPFGKLRCPSCGSHAQRFSMINSLRRVAEKNCNSCGAKISSDLGLGRYVLLLLYAHTVLAVIIAPFVLGMAGRRWGVAAASVVVFVALVWPAATMLHASNVARHNREERGAKH